MLGRQRNIRNIQPLLDKKSLIDASAMRWASLRGPPGVQKVRWIMHRLLLEDDDSGDSCVPQWSPTKVRPDASKLGSSKVGFSQVLATRKHHLRPSTCNALRRVADIGKPRDK